MANQYLFDPNKQFQNKSGTNNVAGFLRVFYNGTDDRAVTYKDFNGTANPVDIPIDNNGRAVVIVDDSYTYRLEVYGRDGALLWTQYPLSAVSGGGGSEATKQYFLLHQVPIYPADTYIKSSDVQKLKIVPSVADVSMSNNFVIDTENNEIRGLDPSKKYLVNISFMFDNGGTLAPHHVDVSGTQWCGTNYYNEIITNPAIDTTEWRSMSWVIAYKDSLSIYVSGSADASDSSYVTMWLRDLQIVEI